MSDKPLTFRQHTTILRDERSILNPGEEPRTALYVSVDDDDGTVRIRADHTTITLTEADWLAALDAITDLRKAAGRK